MTDIVVEVGESFSRLKVMKGVNLNLNLITNACSFDIPNAKYSEKFERGEWDGKYKMFNTVDLSFPTGLLYSVIQALDIEYYDFEVKKIYTPPTINKFDWGIKNVEFRPYQINCINEAFQIKRGIIKVPTGGGKTTIAAGIISKFGVQTLFLVHTKDLLYQTYNAFKKLLPTADIGIIGDGNVIYGNINVATIQTIASKIENVSRYYGDYGVDTLEKYGDEPPIIVKLKPTNITSQEIKSIVDSAQLLIIDEAHHTPASIFYKVAMHSKTPYKFGLTATPQRDDGYDLKIQAGIGEIIYSVKIRELIRDGYLALPYIKFMDVFPIAFPKKATFAHVYSKYIVENQIRNEIIKAIAIEYAEKNAPTLILTKQLRHMNILHNMIPQSVIIHGEMEGIKREKIIADFKQHKILNLIGTTIADEGIDLPPIECLILAGGGRSSVKTIQRIGRAIRLSDQCPYCMSYDVRIKSINDECICNICGEMWIYQGKKTVDIYDFKDNSKKFVFDHYLARKSIYQEEEFNISYRKIQYTNE